MESIYLNTGEALDMKDAKRSELITVAESEVSSDAVKGSAIVLGYWRDACPQMNSDQLRWAYEREQWCGVFTLWCLHQVGLAKRFDWNVGKGYVGAAKLQTTIRPKPGDIAYDNEPNQHYAVNEPVYNVSNLSNETI
jgi:hypothetical protein